MMRFDFLTRNQAHFFILETISPGESPPKDDSPGEIVFARIR